MTLREFAVSETGEAVSVAIIDTIADLENTTVADVNPALYEVIDPDALDRLFASTAGSERVTGYVRFEYDDYDVSISSAGLVRIENGTKRDDTDLDGVGESA